VAFPTDTVYGLGAVVSDPVAIARIYRAKGRSEEKAISVLLADVGALSGVARRPSAAAMKLARRYWPGALTLVVRRHPSLPPELSHTGTVGLRIPDHPVALALLKAGGPLAVTSANRSGGRNPRTAQDVLNAIGGQIELILDGGVTPGGVPSTVVDCTSNPVKILREGPISEAEILDFLAA
jgi:L-threonylcarbamoyladenylate synthase